jgi:hypothetical protein
MSLTHYTTVVAAAASFIAYFSLLELAARAGMIRWRRRLQAVMEDPS